MDGVNQESIYGCDIGSANGYVSVLYEGSKDPVEMFPSQYRISETGMPAVAYVHPPEGERIEVFDKQPAVDKYKRDAAHLLHSIKTRWKTGTIPMPGLSKPVSVQRAYAAIARDLVKLGNEERKNMGRAPMHRLVFTYPASFAEDMLLLNRMQAAIEEEEVDGEHLQVVGRLPEPAAVAIDYLYYMQNIAPEEIRLKKEVFTALVYDLGHGTFDTAVVTAKSKGEPYQLHMSDGLADVGGKDFDRVILEKILSHFALEYDYTPKNENEREELRRLAVRIKHGLSGIEFHESYEDSVTLRDGTVAEFSMKRETFEKLTHHLLQQTFVKIADILERAKQENISIDAIVLSGGASVMPMVRNGLHAMFAEEQIPVRIYRASKAVSFGAARYAAGLENVEKDKKEVTDEKEEKEEKEREPSPQKKVLELITEYGYGVWYPSETKREGVVYQLVTGKEKMPVISQPVRYMSPSLEMKVRVYQTREKNVEGKVLDVSQCEEVMRIPFCVPANTPCEVQIEVLEERNINVICKTPEKTMQKNLKEWTYGS